MTAVAYSIELPTVNKNTIQTKYKTICARKTKKHDIVTVSAILTFENSKTQIHANISKTDTLLQLLYSAVPVTTHGQDYY